MLSPVVVQAQGRPVVVGHPAAQGSPHPPFGRQIVPAWHWQLNDLPQLFLR